MKPMPDGKGTSKFGRSRLLAGLWQRADGKGRAYRGTPFWRAYDARQLIDQKVGWHRLPLVAGLAVFVGVRNILRRCNLYDTRAASAMDGSHSSSRVSSWSVRRTAPTTT